MGKRQQVRRQHVVSRFYLKGFARDQKQILRVSLGEQESHIVSVNDATVVKDFYSVEIGGQLSDFFEHRMSALEDPAAVAVQQVQQRMWPLREESRRSLAAWIALQYLRSHAVRDSGTELRAQMIRLIVGVSGKQRLREHIERAEGGSISDDRLDAEWGELTRPGGPQLQEDVSAHLRTISDLVGPVATHIYGQQWSLNIFERKSLLTSDHPVVLIPDQDHPSWMGVGIYNAAGIMVPLTRSAGLVIGASPGSPDMLTPGTTRMAQIMNEWSLKTARRHIYVHPDDRALVVSLDVPPRRTSEIEGSAADAWIEEEGVLSHLTEAEVRAQQMPSRARQKSDGTSLKDLEWPIPGRISNLAASNDLE